MPYILPFPTSLRELGCSGAPRDRATDQLREYAHRHTLHFDFEIVYGATDPAMKAALIDNVLHAQELTQAAPRVSQGDGSSLQLPRDRAADQSREYEHRHTIRFDPDDVNDDATDPAFKAALIENVQHARELTQAAISVSEGDGEPCKSRCATIPRRVLTTRPRRPATSSMRPASNTS